MPTPPIAGDLWSASRPHLNAQASTSSATAGIEITIRRASRSDDTGDEATGCGAARTRGLEVHGGRDRGARRAPPAGSGVPLGRGPRALHALAGHRPAR